MKRAVLGAMVLAVAMVGVGCDQQDKAAKVDPKLDGLSGLTAAVDPTIFENHAELFRRVQPVAAPAAAPVAPEASSEAAPATDDEETMPDAPATEDTAPPPPE